MIKYELRRGSAEIKKESGIKEGCTLSHDTAEIIKAYDDKGEALKALKGYESSAKKTGGFTTSLYDVTEYYIEENEYDEDGNWISGGDVWAIAPYPEKAAE